MIKLTVLALFVAFQQSSAEKEAHASSRMLLQVGHHQYYHNPGYPQHQPPQFNPCNPCNPYGGCYEAQRCWAQWQSQQNPLPVAPVQPVAPANPAPPVPPAPVDPTIPPPPPGNGPPPASNNPAPGTPAVNPTPGLPQIQPMPPVGPGGFTPGAPQPGPGGLYPGGPAPLNPGFMPQMPLFPIGGGGGGMTDITCGPMPPAVPCANRNNGPTGAINPMTGQKFGPLTLGIGLANNAKLYCDTPGACANSEVNWNVAPGTSSINQILCSEPGACGGSTMNIKNSPMNGNNVELSNLECGSGGTCNGLTINGWGISLNDVNCAVEADCMGCIFRNMKTVPDMFCRDPYGPNAANNPACAIEVTPCFGY